MKIYLVRHGKTESNKLGTFNGVVDEPISDEGREDLLNKKKLYQGLKFDYGYCSPLKRAQQTFEILFPDKKIDELRDDLAEQDFGDWANQNIREIFEEYIAKGYGIEKFAQPPNGETYEAVYQRTKAFIDEVIQKHQNDEQIVAVAHGMVIASMVVQLDFFKDKSVLELAPDNGLGYIVEVKDKKVSNIEVIKELD